MNHIKKLILITIIFNKLKLKILNSKGKLIKECSLSEFKLNIQLKILFIKSFIYSCLY